MTFLVKNDRVYDLEETILASGYPMQITTDDTKQVTDKDVDRFIKLANTPMGSGHSCSLKGVLVSHDITASQNFWMQFERYHFSDIVSSQSKMHRICKFDVGTQCNEYVDKTIIAILKDLIEMYNKVPSHDHYLKVLYNVPCGFELTARVTSNYLQLKSIYAQRCNHTLDEWKDYCNWIKSLPYMERILLSSAKT